MAAPPGVHAQYQTNALLSGLYYRFKLNTVLMTKLGSMDLQTQ
jgi:hypothetical protein